jgi:hypothetical protein
MSPEAYLLADEHGGIWKENDKFPVADWQRDVSEDNTRLGYWDWLLGKLEIAAAIPPDLPDLIETPNDE